jgi:hypothetical protein
LNNSVVGEIDVAGEAIEDLQSNAFKKAKRLIEVARFIFTGDAAQPEPLTTDGDQATRVPSSETVQKPAGE